MRNHIDLGTVLKQTLAASLYSNLVTRPTGEAVRGIIERMLESWSEERQQLAVIDFSHVSMIDFSCADEIIAKLLLHRMRDASRETYFLFRGMTEGHWHAVEPVLERHGLALVVERESGVDLAGVLEDGERRTWEAVKRRGRAGGGCAAWQLAGDLGEPEPAVRTSLDRMWSRRLIMRSGDVYMPVGDVS